MAIAETFGKTTPVGRALPRRRQSDENKAPPSALKLARRLGLRYVSADTLTLRRKRLGEKFSYVDAEGRTIKDTAIRQRLKSLAVPPAYEDVLYAADERAHLQAVGRDAAGRLQYRYHADWEKVREHRKAARLATMAEALPRIRRAVGRSLSEAEPCRAFALAAVIELVARSAIRAGGESYARLSGTRGATTLLKSNVSVEGGVITLKFRAKGGKSVMKQFSAPRLSEAIARLRDLPGHRLFQYRGEDGQVRPVSARSVNAFLREIAGVHISLKDFRTLLASVSVLEALARETPATSKPARRRQVLEAIRAAADDLSNTPAICGKSYVHDIVVEAFEEGTLEQFAETLRATRSVARREQMLAQVIATAAA